MDPAKQDKRLTSAYVCIYMYISPQLSVALKNVRPLKTIFEFLGNLLFWFDRNATNCMHVSL